MKKQVKQVNKITQKDLGSFKKAYADYKEASSVITNRVDYILRKTAELFGGKIDWWDWTNGEGECDGHITTDMLFDSKGYIEEYIDLDGSVGYGRKHKDWVAILNGAEWEFGLCVPTKFLFEDFEDELKEGIKKYDAIQKEEASQFLREKEEMKELKKEVLSKLTKAERDALKHG